MERQTRQREAVLGALATGGQALTPSDICARARIDVPTLNLSTVYRQLKDLESSGDVLRVELSGQATRFESRCARDHGRAAHHHHHFHCTACDRVFAIHACPGPMQRLAPRGFRVEQHELTLHGRCADCAP